MAGNIDSPRVITNARSATSVEMSHRVRRYAITMAFRMACFVGIFFVEGWLRWALFAAAVFLPYIAVLFANQANTKGGGGSVIVPGAPADAPQLTQGAPVTDDDAPHEVVSGEVVSDEQGQQWSRPPWNDRQDRVA